MARIDYKNDLTRAVEEAEGSDGRLNVSSRSDERAYYNSRDEGQCYTVPFDFQSATATEFGAYWKNTSTNGKDLVISSIGVNAVNACRVKLWFVTGTAAGGTTITPTNLNRASSNAATATAMEGGTAATGIAGITGEDLVDFLYVPALGHEEFRLSDRIRLGQNDAIAIEYFEGTTGDFSGVIFGYYE